MRLAHFIKNHCRAMLGSNFELTADVILAELAEKSSVLVGQKIVKSETGADKHFFDAGQGAELSKERKVVAVVHLEIGTGLRVQTAAVLAGAVCHLLAAGRCAELGGRAADVEKFLHTLLEKIPVPTENL